VLLSKPKVIFIWKVFRSLTVFPTHSSCLPIGKIWKIVVKCARMSGGKAHLQKTENMFGSNLFPSTVEIK